MNESFMNGLLNVAGKMQSNKVLSAIKDGFIDNMPLVIVGAFCTLFQWVVFHYDPPGSSVTYLSLANVPGLHWLNVLTPIVTTINYGTMNFMGLNVCMLVAVHFAENLGHKGDKVVPALAVASFITLVNTTITTSTTAADVVSASNGALELASGADGTEAISLSAGSGVLQSYTDANGLFVGLLVGILATLLYVKLIDSGKLTIKLPDSVPPNVAQSFAVLFPVALTLLAVSVVGFIFNQILGQNIFGVINAIMAPLQAIMTGLPGYLVIVFLMMLLWFFGIHGPNVMSAVTSAFFMKAVASNQALYAQTGDPYLSAGAEWVANNADKAAELGISSNGYYIISNTFASVFFAETGSGITGGFIIAVLLFSKRDDYRAVAKVAIPCGIFNINEPIIFGIPMVMNPLMAIPFFVSPIASVVIGYVLIRVGFCPALVVDAPWTTPVGILGFLASGGRLTAAITQLLAFAVSIILYTPFVIAANKQAPEGAAA